MSENEFTGCIGIDLGTTYSCVAVWNGDRAEVIPNELGNRITPSWVSFTDEERLVGESAKKLAPTNSKNTLFDVKRIIGRRCNDEEIIGEIQDYPFRIVSDEQNVPRIVVTYKDKEHEFRPEEISAMVLSKMKEIAECHLGKTVTKAVITVPAYFNDSQKTATKNAATIAGLNCLRIINEPTAACLCYGIDKKHNETKILVFDLGGGTFDVSLLELDEGVFRVLATSGDTHLGGEDIDHILIDYFLERFISKYPDAKPHKSQRAMSRLRTEVEELKRALSTSEKATIELISFSNDEDLIDSLTRAKFESLCAKLFQRCMIPVNTVLKDARVSESEIEEVVLVGGSTRIPKIRSLLAEKFGREPNCSVHPDEAVALGAAIQGAILSKSDDSGKTKDIVLLDLIPLSLGIESKNGIMSVIIERNTQVPITKSKMYTTVEDKQTSVRIQVYEGEREFTKDNNKLGDFELKGLHKMVRGAIKIEVKFTIDVNGILTVRAVDRDTGNKEEVVICNSTRLSEEEVTRMIEDAQKFKADDMLRKESIIDAGKFEQYLYDVQNAINNRELIYDDEGNPVITEEEKTFVDQCILSCLSWLEEGIQAKDYIEQARLKFESNIKQVMYKIFTRKKQIDMKGRLKVEQEADLETTMKVIFDEED